MIDVEKSQKCVTTSFRWCLPMSWLSFRRNRNDELQKHLSSFLFSCLHITSKQKYKNDAAKRIFYLLLTRVWKGCHHNGYEIKIWNTVISVKANRNREIWVSVGIKRYLAHTPTPTLGLMWGFSKSIGFCRQLKDYSGFFYASFVWLVVGGYCGWVDMSVCATQVTLSNTPTPSSVGIRGVASPFRRTGSRYHFLIKR